MKEGVSIFLIVVLSAFFAACVAVQTSVSAGFVMTGQLICGAAITALIVNFHRGRTYEDGVKAAADILIARAEKAFEVYEEMPDGGVARLARWDEACEAERAVLALIGKEPVSFTDDGEDDESEGKVIDLHVAKGDETKEGTPL